MHFFTEQDLTGAAEVLLDGPAAHHMIHVLRAHPGEKAEISDSRGRIYDCTLIGIREDGAMLSVDREIQKNRELPSRITLYQGLPKGDKMSLIIQKAVELGVGRIAPVIMERSVARPDRKSAAHKLQRWQKIAASAAEQCGRAVIPEVLPVRAFDEVLGEAAEADRFLLPYECAEGMERTRSLFSDLPAAGEIAVMIGPEGGYTPQEIESAEKAGAMIMTLGNRILRAETAAITALSWIVFQLEP